MNFISGISLPAGGLAVDGSHLYWTSYDPNHWDPPLYPGTVPARIGRANLNGTGVEESFIFDAPRRGVAVDDTHVWWVYSAPFGRHGAHARQLLCSPPAGSSVPTWTARGPSSSLNLARRFNKSFDICGIAVNDTHVYWTEDESIGRANLDGSRATHELITGSAGLWRA